MRALQLLLSVAVALTAMAGAMDLPKTRASDYGLRGPIKQSIERTMYPSDDSVPDRSFATTRLYSPNGWLLEERREWSPASDYLTTNTYDSAGRIVRVSAGNDSASGTEKSETTYAYDKKGQLLSIRSNSGMWELKYELDQNGRQCRVDHWPVRPVARDVGVGAIHWEASELYFAPPSGGTVTTIYDKQDRPVQAEIRDADGRISMRMFRTYDERGHVLTDKLLPEDMRSAVPAELSEKMNDAQTAAIAQFIGDAFGSGEATYRYDAQGRVVEKHSVSGTLGDLLTTITYNEHGDVSIERSVHTEGPFTHNEFQIGNHGQMVPSTESKIPEPSRAETRNIYEYDAHGNWTKKTTSVGQPESGFKTSTVVDRTLQYY